MIDDNAMTKLGVVCFKSNLAINH